MCKLFAQQPPQRYAYQTRSIRIGGHCTSIRLENVFWDILEDIAARERSSVAKFVTTLYDEVLANHGEVHNVASLLRCSCLLYASDPKMADGVTMTPPRADRMIAAE